MSHRCPTLGKVARSPTGLISPHTYVHVQVQEPVVQWLSLFNWSLIAIRPPIFFKRLRSIVVFYEYIVSLFLWGLLIFRYSMDGISLWKALMRPFDSKKGMTVMLHLFIFAVLESHL